jgi:hypothetical protein
LKNHLFPVQFPSPPANNDLHLNKKALPGDVMTGLFEKDYLFKLKYCFQADYVG